MPFCAGQHVYYFVPSSANSYVDYHNPELLWVSKTINEMISLVTNRQANCIKDIRQGKLVSLSILAFKDDLLEG